MAYATGKGLSQRRACTLLGVARSALGYRSVKAARDAPVLRRMTELSAQYPRYGYRRIAIFLGRDGHVMSFGRARVVADVLPPPEDPVPREDSVKVTLGLSCPSVAFFKRAAKTQGACRTGA